MIPADLQAKAASLIEAMEWSGDSPHLDGLETAIAEALMQERSRASAEIDRLCALLAPFADKGHWFQATHRPEIPGPYLPIIFFSDNPWSSNDMEPWKAANPDTTQERTP